MQRCSREVSQAPSQQRAEPAQAMAKAVPAREAGLVRERSSQVAAQQAASQLPGPGGAAQRNRTAPVMRRLRLLK